MAAHTEDKKPFILGCSVGIGNTPSCEAIVASTDTGTCRVSPKKCPRQRSVQSWTANPNLLIGLRHCSTCSKSDAVSVKYLRRMSGSISSGRRSGTSNSCATSLAGLSAVFMPSSHQYSSPCRTERRLLSHVISVGNLAGVYK
jgi:hypothetical protein